jgi:hypothetical protein
MNSRFEIRFFFPPRDFFPTSFCVFFFHGPLTVPHGRIGCEAQAVAGILCQGSMAGRFAHLVEGSINGGSQKIHLAEIKIHNQYPQNKKCGQPPLVQVALTANP